MTRVTVQIRDEELVRYLEETDNQSEVIREALRSQYVETETDGMGPDLTNVEREGLEVLCGEAFELPDDQRNARKISKSVAQSILAQRLQIEMDSAIRVVIRPLLNEGYLRLDDRASALLVFREPQPVDNSKSREAADWETAVERSECDPHKPDSSGFCWKCGETVGEPDSSNSESAFDGQLVACEGNCSRMLHVSSESSTRVCRECRAPEGQK